MTSRIKSLSRTAFFSGILLLLASAALSVPGEDEGGYRVDVAIVEDIINPITAEFIADSIRKAEKDGSTCLVIQLDTPGGLDTAMRDIIKSIFTSEVPVVVYVAPSGARAASAGVLITMAAHVAAMAPGTNIGAAHPVAMGGGEMDEVMMKKIENDAAAYSESIAKKRGRNIEWAVNAVRESVSEPAERALEIGVIDIMPATLDELLEAIDGREVETPMGKKVIQTKGATVHTKGMGLRQKILNVISNPTIALMLLSLGGLGLSIELYNPGVVFPGVFGAICLVLGFFALQTLPVNYAGVLLILLAFLFFIAEFKVVSYGALTIGGIIAMTLGSLMLFKWDTRGEMVGFMLKGVAPIVITITAFFVFAMTYVFKAQRTKPKTGYEGLIGEVGEARTAIVTEGTIFVHGEYWNARSDEAISAGDKVEVIGVENLLALVKKVS